MDTIVPLANTRSAAAIVSRNIRFLYLEIAFASVLGAIITFNSAFAIRLGAPNELVALLTAGPALVSAIASIPTARFLSRRTRRKAWLFGSLFIYRLGYLGIAFMPILYPVNTAAWLVIWTLALNLPLIFFTNGWHVLLGDLIPSDRRAFVISRRQILWSLGLIVVSALGGEWLYRQPFPLNYELLFGFGFVTVMGSQLFLQLLVVPPHVHLQSETSDLDAPIEPIRMRPPIARQLFNMTIYQIGLSLPSALFNIYYIRSLGATDAWIGFNGAAANLGVIAGYYMWERLLKRHSFGWAQRRATLITWTFPAVVAFIPNLTVILAANFFVNMMHSGVDLANFNVLLNISKPHERAAYISWFNSGINVSIFAATLIGTYLASPWGIAAVMILSVIFRLVGGLLCNFRRVEEPTTGLELKTAD